MFWFSSVNQAIIRKDRRENGIVLNVKDENNYLKDAQNGWESLLYIPVYAELLPIFILCKGTNWRNSAHPHSQQLCINDSSPRLVTKTMPPNCPPQPNRVSRSPPRFIFPLICHPSASIHPFIAACMALLDSFSSVDDSVPFHNTSTISVSWSGLYCFALRPEYSTPPTPLTVLGKVSHSSLLFGVMVNAPHAGCVSLFS